VTARHHKVIDSEQPSGSHAEDESGAPGKERRTEYLTANQLAAILQISEGTIHRLRRAGRIPAVMLTNRLIRFNLRDVQRALRPMRSHDALEHEQHDEGPDPQLSFEGFDTL